MKNTLITAAIIAVFIYVPYMFGSVLYDDDMAVYLWVKGFILLFVLSLFTSGLTKVMLFIYENLKNWKV